VSGRQRSRHQTSRHQTSRHQAKSGSEALSKPAITTCMDTRGPSSYRNNHVKRHWRGAPVISPAKRYGQPPNADGAYPTRRDLIQAALRAGYKLRQAALIDPRGSLPCLPVKCPGGWALSGPSGRMDFAWIPPT